MKGRRERFREAMAQLAPAGSPENAIERGLYVERPGRSAVSVISARLELDPTASFLLVGGVGSGKTTELLMTAKKLNDLDDVHAFYIDVSALHDIKKMKAGSLIAVAGLSLAHQTPALGSDDADANEATEALLRAADGYGYYRDDSDEPGDWDSPDDGPPAEWVWVPGAVEPPKDEARALEPVVDYRSKLLARMCAPLRKQKPHIVLIFDSLDRKRNLGDFKQIIWEDAEALHRVGIGVLLTAPLAIMYGESRVMIEDFFQERTFLQTAVDVKHDKQAIDFLTRVINARAPEAMIPADACLALAEASGGVLRDLIALGHLAIQEAYAAGADHVGLSHVERAAKTFGRQFLRQLSEEEHNILNRLRTKGQFFGVTDEELNLLAERRIVVYSTTDGDTRYAVHPTIEPFLAPMGQASNDYE